MNAGKLKHRITLQRPATGQDALGQPLTGWEVVAANVYANVRFSNGKEFIAGEQLQTGVTASVRIRRRTVSRDWRVLYKGVTYAIQADLPSADGVYIDLVVRQEGR